MFRTDIFGVIIRGRLDPLLVLLFKARFFLYTISLFNFRLNASHLIPIIMLQTFQIISTLNPKNQTNTSDGPHKLNPILPIYYNLALSEHTEAKSPILCKQQSMGDVIESRLYFLELSKAGSIQKVTKTMTQVILLIVVIFLKCCLLSLLYKSYKFYLQSLNHKTNSNSPKIYQMPFQTPYLQSAMHQLQPQAFFDLRLQFTMCANTNRRDGLGQINIKRQNQSLRFLIYQHFWVCGLINFLRLILRTIVSKSPSSFLKVLFMECKDYSLSSYLSIERFYFLLNRVYKSGECSLLCYISVYSFLLVSLSQSLGKICGRSMQCLFVQMVAIDLRVLAFAWALKLQFFFLFGKQLYWRGLDLRVGCIFSLLVEVDDNFFIINFIIKGLING